jgi:hypothetical protein
MSLSSHRDQNSRRCGRHWQAETRVKKIRGACPGQAEDRPRVSRILNTASQTAARAASATRHRQ